MIGYSTAQIEDRMRAIRAYLEREGEKAPSTALGRTSSFWQTEFAARPNYPSVSDFLAFRREGFTHGMADGFSFDLRDPRAQSTAKEEQHARRTGEIFRQSAAPARIVALDEPALGAPYLFENFGAARSASFWTNAVTALRVQDILAATHKDQKPLDILEIGAGWGCMAAQLHQALTVNSYTIVDLPKNLLLSGTYLSSVASLDLRFAEGARRSVSAPHGTLLCAVPDCVEAIGQKYDLVVNAFSLQEMDLETVQGYFAWIADVLKPSGLFISLNSHGKAGVRVSSDYPMEHFDLERLGMFRAYPSGLLNTIPYEMVLSRRGEAAPVDPQLMNVLCCLIQFGLDQDLADIFAAFTRGDLPPPQAQGLRALAGYFSTAPSKRAIALEQSAGALPAAVHAYLAGMHAFVAADKKAGQLLDKALDGDLRGFARLRASAMLAITNRRKELEKWGGDFDARLAYPELAKILDESDSGQFIAQFGRIVAANLS